MGSILNPDKENSFTRLANRENKYLFVDKTDFIEKTNKRLNEDNRFFAVTDLGNNGLTNSNEQLKTYAVIAHGTGRDINTLTDAVIAFSQGSTKALRQFGITAKDNGDTISLTYKGSTTEIEKNSKALDSYLSDLAKNNFDGVLEAKLNTVSAPHRKTG